MRTFNRKAAVSSALLPATVNQKPTRGIDRLCCAFLSDGYPLSDHPRCDDDDKNGGGESAAVVSLRALPQEAGGGVLAVVDGSDSGNGFFTKSLSEQELLPHDTTLLEPMELARRLRCRLQDGMSPSLSSPSTSLHRASMSPTDLLVGYGLLWLLADAYGLYKIHEELLLSSDGATGFSEVMSMKRGFLMRDDNGCGGNTAYYNVDAIHAVDVQDRAVIAGFECLLPGEEGRGTEVAVFNEDYKVIKVEAIQHPGPCK